MVHEECGIVGIYLKNPKLSKENFVPNSLYIMLNQLQHRGQLSAGISVYSPGSFGDILKTSKKVGSVDELFQVQDSRDYLNYLNSMNGLAGIGHVRYATAGSRTSARDGAQPFERRHGRLRKNFAIGFNGNLVNQDELADQLSENGYHLNTDVDTELIMHNLSLGLNITEDLFDAHKKAIENLDGAYSIIDLFASGEMFFLRDSLGFKPLVYGETEDFFAIASESVALKKLGLSDFKIVNPSEGILFKDNKTSSNILKTSRKAYCHFEEVYFSSSFSQNLPHQSVYTSRLNLGKKLAQLEDLVIDENFVVVPVPKTAITASEAYAFELKIPLSFALEKVNGKRGFINQASDRQRIMHSGYGIHSESIKDKKVILIDDSIVRGETSKIITKLLRDAGAKEIHLRSTEPPILFPCFYGIDFPTKKELVTHVNEQNLANHIGVDSLKFMTIQGLVESLGIPENELCLACLNGNYPTKCGQEKFEEILQNIK